MYNPKYVRSCINQTIHKRRWFAAVLLDISALILFISMLLPLNMTSMTDKPAEQIFKHNYATAERTIYAKKNNFVPNQVEVEALTRMLYGEARGIPSDMEKAACVWCVLNRVDNLDFPDTVLAVLEQPHQFAGYSPNYPVTEKNKAIATDVLTRWMEERAGVTDVGRVLPAEYLFFTGDGEHNIFTNEWCGDATWNWSLENPYEN